MLTKINGVLLCGLLVINANYAMVQVIPFHNANILTPECQENAKLFMGPSYTVDQEGNTELHYAATNGASASVLRLLKVMPFLANAKNKSAKTALHCAAEGQNGLACVQFLIEYGADINAQTICSRTALEYAIFCDRADIVDYLLARGAKINPGTVNLAFKNGQLQFFVMLLKLIQYNNKEHGITCLHYLAEMGLLNEVEYLLELQQKIVNGQELNETETGIQKIVVDTNAKDELGRTPLHCAILSKNCTLLKLLVDHGAQVDEPDENGACPLHYAARCCDANLMQVLLELGADPDVQDHAKKTAMHYAVEADDREDVVRLLRVLLNFGASTVIGDNEDSCPIDIVKHSGIKAYLQEQMEQELLKRWKNGEEMPENINVLFVPKPKRAFMFPVEWLKDVPMVITTPSMHNPVIQQSPVFSGQAEEEFNESMVITDDQSQKEEQPEEHFVLSPLLYRKAPSIIEFLLKYHKLDPCKADETGKTPLHHLVQGKGNVNQIRAFCEAGGDINARDATGRTALHYAVLGGRSTVLYRLLERGADTRIVDSGGKRAEELSNDKSIKKAFSTWRLVQQIPGEFQEEQEQTGKDSCKRSRKEALLH